MVRSITHVLLLALVAQTSISTSPPSTETTTSGSQQEQTCIAPTVVSTLEAKIQLLEQSNAQWTTKLETATSTWENEKSVLEQQLADIETKHREMLVKASELDQKMVENEQTHQETMKQVSTLDKSVQELDHKLKEEKKGSNTLLERLGLEQKKGRTLLDKIKELEQEIASARKDNEALRAELGKMDDRLTLSSLLSVYYDEGVLLSGHVYDALKAQTEQRWTQFKGAATELDITQLSVWKPAEKLYATHLASTMDPVVANVHRVMEPHIAAYRPIMTKYIQNSKKTISYWYKKAIKRGNRVRGEATRLVQQYPAIAPYASTLVDGAMALVAIPLIIVALRVVINTLWWILTTIICVLSCGCCCGAKKRSKLKRKMSRKQLSSPTNPIITTSKKTILSPAKTTEKRRISGKKK